LNGPPRPPRITRATLLGVVTLAAVALGAPMSAVAAPHVPIAGDAALDRQATHVLERLVEGDVERATVLARALARRHPRFALGQLLHAELSAIAALDDIRAGSGRSWSPALIDLLLEARARLDAGVGRSPGSRAEERPRVLSDNRPGDPRGDRPDDRADDPPAPFVQIGRDIEHVVLVDLARSALTLHAVSGGLATPVREHYVSSGSAGFGKRREGDRRTPLGLYRITRFTDDRALPELYGAGALVLDYPNAFDRHLGRTGSGIWLHGVPRGRRSRAPRSSEGCVTMSNEHLLALGERLDPEHTLVLLAAPASPADIDSAGRTDLSRARADRAEARERYRALFDGWRKARLRDGSASPGIADLDVNDVTILETTASGLPGVPDLLVMDMRTDTGDAARTTLWWSRPAGTGDWTLTLERADSAGT